LITLLWPEILKELAKITYTASQEQDLKEKQVIFAIITVKYAMIKIAEAGI
jgi:hypothetical protein